MFIKHQNLLQTFEEFNVSKAILDRKISSLDTLTLNIVSTENPFNADDYVEVFDDDYNRLFAGRVKFNPKYNSTLVDKHEIIVNGPWAELEQIIYQQLWNVAEFDNDDVLLEPTLRSKVIIGQNSDGEKITPYEQILDILNYAIDAGAGFQIGNIDVDFQLIFDETKDITCAQALTRVMRWLPFGVMYFDYSSSSSLPSINISHSSTLSQQKIYEPMNLLSRPRHDLNVAGVVVKYELQHSLNDENWLTVEVDKYPLDIDEQAKNTIVFSVELDGQTGSNSQHELICETISINSVDWWKSHVPALTSSDSLLILDSSRLFPDLQRELTYGTIPDSLDYTYANETVSALVKYTDSNGSLVQKTISVNLIATNAFTGTYTVWNSYSSPEEVPTGLAQTIYEACSSLLYEGSFKIISTYPNAYFAKNIYIDDYLDVPSPVVSSSYNFQTNVLDLTFGPPKHLYPDDISELFRIAKPVQYSYTSLSRDSGKYNTPTVKISGATPQNNSGQGDNTYEKLIIGYQSSTSIDLDYQNIPENSTAYFQQHYITVNGELATAYFLMTEPEIL